MNNDEIVMEGLAPIDEDKPVNKQYSDDRGYRTTLPVKKNPTFIRKIFTSVWFYLILTLIGMWYSWTTTFLMLFIDFVAFALVARFSPSASVAHKDNREEDDFTKACYDPVFRHSAEGMLYKDMFRFDND